MVRPIAEMLIQLLTGFQGTQEAEAATLSPEVATDETPKGQMDPAAMTAVLAGIINPPEKTKVRMNPVLGASPMQSQNPMKDFVTGMLDEITKMSDKELKGWADLKPAFEITCTIVFGREIKFPKDPEGTRAMARQLLAEINEQTAGNETGQATEVGQTEEIGTVGGQGQQTEEIGTVEGQDQRTEGTGTTEVGQTEEIGTVGGQAQNTGEIGDTSPVQNGYERFTQEDIAGFVELMDKAGVEKDLMTMKKERDQLNANPEEKRRIMELYSKFVNVPTDQLPPKVREAYGRNRAVMESNIQQIPDILVNSKPKYLDDDPQRGIRQLYDFAIANDT